MTFQTDQIQLLIADIDGVLGKTRKSRLGWLNFGNSTQERQVLERVRTNLQKLYNQLTSTTITTPMGREIVALPALPVKPENSLPSDGNQPQTPTQILQAVVQEMGYLRTFYERATYTHLRQQYQADLETLHQQRQTLIEEIKQLEEQRKIYTSLTEEVLPQKELESGSISEKNNHLLSKELTDGGKTAVGQEQVISSERHNPIAIPETLPYAGTELMGELIELNQRSAQKAEDHQADPIDSPQADGEEISDISDNKPPVRENEDTPEFLTANSCTEESLISQEQTSYDTISALTDLIGSPSDADKTDNLENTTPLATTTTDIEDIAPITENFLPASPDEDLLPTLESSTKSNIDLWLGKNMLDQLSEDLSSLEGMGNTEVQEPADRIEVGEDKQPTSHSANETQSNKDEIPTTQPDQDFNSDQQAPHSYTQIETVDPLEAVTEEVKQGIPFNIPEEVLAEFDDLFGESADKIDRYGVAEEQGNLPVNADRQPEEEKKN